MSTVRIQVRRGTASQWTSVNPILAAGEMGVESDTNLFKFGNGSSTWTALAYANNSDVAIGEISQDAINSALTMGSGLTKTYNDGANTITIAVDASYFNELAQDAVNSALTAGTGITKVYDDAANTLTVAVDTSVIANKTYVDNQISGLANTVDTDYIPVSDRGVANGVASLDSSGFVPTAQLNIDERVEDVLASTIVAGRGISTTYNDSANTFTLSENITAGSGIVKTNDSSGTGITLSLPAVINASTKFTAPLVEVQTVSATDVNTQNITISGNLTVNGTTTTVNSTNVSIDDPMIYIGDNNQSNALDLGVVAAFNNGTYQHSGIVRDASDGIWKLFSGVTAEPTTVVDFTTYTKDALEVGGLFADAAKIGDTTNAEIQRVHGVTSPIQTQLDSKLSISDAQSTYAAKISPTFTGTVTLPTGTITSSMIADGTILNADINASAAIAQSKIASLVSDLSAINSTLSTNSSNITTLQADATALGSTKAPIANPTFTGTVVLPSTTSIGGVSQLEIATLDGVTSSIQTQINTINTSVGTATTNIATHTSDIDTIKSNVTAINTNADNLQTQINTKASSASLTTHTSGTTNVHGIADTSALALTATVNSGLALKAPLASPTFTGTVSGITKTMVGLGNADNTADSAKPISTAAQAALDLKAPLASPALTGVPTAPTAAAGTSTTQVATTAFVGTAVSALVASAPAALDTLNELATALGNDASFSTTITNSIATKAPLASPTFTGTVTAPAITATALITASASGVAFTDGTQTKEGVPSRTTIISKTTDYTLSNLSERDSLIEINAAGATTLTIPADSSTNYPVGTSLDILRVGAGALTVSPAAGVTLNYTPGNKLRAQWSSATLVKRAANTWVLLGDLTA